MLILSRKTQESILIGDDIEIIIINVRGQYTRIGIAAPDHVKILRKEILSA